MVNTTKPHSGTRNRFQAFCLQKKNCMVFRLSPFLLNNRKWNMGSRRKYFLWEVSNVLIRILQVSRSGAGKQQMAAHVFSVQHVDSKVSGLSTARNSNSKHWYITTVIGGAEILSYILNVCLQNKDSRVLLPLYRDIAQTGLEFMIFLPRPPQSTNAF